MTPQLHDPFDPANYGGMDPRFRMTTEDEVVKALVAIAKLDPQELEKEPLSPTTPPAPPSGLRGFGDVVALVAQPIAKAIDAVAGTDFQNCGGCKWRQELLNQLIPFGTNESGTTESQESDETPS